MCNRMQMMNLLKENKQIKTEKILPESNINL